MGSNNIYIILSNTILKYNLQNETIFIYKKILFYLQI